MTPLISNANLILSTGTVLAQIASLILLIRLIFFRNTPSSLFSNLAGRATLYMFVIALLATLGSLFYSEIAGYTPCKFCWFQRIFMYPQVFLLGLALYKKDIRIIDYSILLSAVGALIAGYHYLMQIGFMPELPCAAVGASATCSKIFVMHFGYITIPLMSFSAFLLMLLIGVLAKRTR